MKKKLVVLLLTIGASIGTIMASNTQVDGIWYDFDDQKLTASVTFCGSSYNSYSNEYTGVVDIPSSVKYNAVNYTVTSIRVAAFYGCVGLTSVTIPNSVTSIGNSAFYGCAALTSVTIPNSVTNIEDNAFYGCAALISVAIPNSVTSIGDNAFCECTNLLSVTIPNRVTSIGGAAFYGCSGLTSINIPNGVTSIGETAFDFCSIVEIHYGGTIKEWCEKLWNPNSVSSSYTLYIGDKKITNIVIPKSITSIGEYAFAGCIGLTSIEIPNNVTSIGEYVFAGCSDLASIEIPNSVTSIGDYAFRDCTGLTSVTIPNSVTKIGIYAFQNCTGLPVINNIRYADTYLIEAVDKTLSSYTIKEGTRFIELAAFARCSSLTSIEIPNSVISIGGTAFAYCTSLTTINMANDNPNFCSMDGIVFNKDKTTLVIFPGGKKGEYTIPNSVTSIGSSAFSGCIGLTSVTIPNSVTSIGGGAFSGCTGLTSVTIPNGVTSFGEAAFVYCTNLTSVTIPNSVISIGGAAFAYCINLASITCEAVTPPTCGYVVFYEASRFITLYVPANSVSAYKATSPWSEWGDNIKPIQASEKVVIEPSAEPTENSVVIDWPKADGAAVYTIDIKKNGVLICTLEFNESGQLLSIDFAAPDRNGRVRNAQEALQISTGWQYTINGLDPNTEYTYTVIAKKSDDSEVYYKTVPFKTKDSATSLDQTSQESIANSQKLLISGQLLILRGDRTYTIDGRSVR